MSRYNFRSHHTTRSNRAFVAFDAVGGGLDLVSAWQIDHPTVTVSMGDTLDDPLRGLAHLGWYTIQVEGYGRGVVMQRPTWMDEDLSPRELAAPRPALEDVDRFGLPRGEWDER